jgi:hypothetical protein
MSKLGPAIRNWETMPPPGGWSLSYIFNGNSFGVTGQSAHSIVEGIAAILRNNGVKFDHAKREEVWAFCNGIWCARDPKRCLTKPLQPNEAAKVMGDHRKKTPSDYGSKLWGWLDTFGMKGQFYKESWMDAISRIAYILNPENEKDVGCSECFTEFQGLISEKAPEDVFDSNGAARWAFWAHNRVNAKIGKPQMEWRKAVIANGWDVELDSAPN